MNKTWGIILAVIIILGGIYYFTRMPSAPQGNQPAGTQGSVVFSVTDAAVDMNAISEITMKVNSVSAHSEGGAWVTVSSTPKTYSLLDLNVRRESELLADIKMNAGTYDQVRLMVDSITVKTKAGVTETAKLPSGELKINTLLLVESGKTSSVNFDFKADKSLHMTGNGGYIFAPVVKIQSESNADVKIDSKNVVTVSSGKIDDANTVGMDIDGELKADFEIDDAQDLNVDSNGVIEVELK